MRFQEIEQGIIPLGFDYEGVRQLYYALSESKKIEFIRFVKEISGIELSAPIYPEEVAP